MKHTLCQNCGVKPAAILYQETRNGVSREMHLCVDCAKAMDLASFQEHLFPSSLFTHAETKKTVCPLCGTELVQVRRTGKFGCSGCYDAFSPLLDLTPYVGKGYDQKPLSQKPEKKESAPAEESLADLRAQLKKAVETENYEKAALLRDRIREKEGNK